MTVEVRIPSPLKSLTGGKELLQSKGTTVGEVIEEVISAHPQLKERLYEENGDVRRFINIFLNNEDIRFMKNLDTPVNDGDNLSIIPAIAGGSKSIPGHAILGQRFTSQWDGIEEERLRGGKVFVLGAGGLGPPPRYFWPRQVLGL